MPRLSTRSATIGLLLSLLIALLLAGQKLRLWEQGWFTLQEWRHASEWREDSLWLPQYQAVVQAKVVAEDLSNLSALTFDPERKTLFSVTNQKPEVIELSLDGDLIRRIPLLGFGDPEAIEYIAPGHFVIADERLQSLHSVRIHEDTKSIDIADTQSLAIGIDLNGNKGFEGLTYDTQGQRLFVAKERDPITIYEIHGFPRVTNAPARALKVINDPKLDERLFVIDISSLVYVPRHNHMLVLSDQSKLLLEMDQQRKPISRMSLTAGEHGLIEDIPQAEGATIDDQGNIYITSEPNLFYRFEPTQRAN